MYIYIYIYIYYICITYMETCPVLILWFSNGGLSTLCHSCGFDYRQRVLKTFLGPGYLRWWGILTMAFTGKFLPILQGGEIIVFLTSESNAVFYNLSYLKTFRSRR